LPPNHSRAIAWFAAALFAVHPVQTEAVTYIVQRFTSLATMFSLAALVLYAKMRLLQESERPFSAKALSLYLFSLVSIILAMKTKEIAITLPVIVALYEFFFFRGPIRSTWPVLTPILLTLLIVPASLLNVQRPLGEIFSAVSDQTGLQPPTGRWDYLATQFRVVTTYTRLLLLPVNQNLDYDYPVSGAFFSPSVFLSFLFLLGLLLAAIFLYIRSSRGTDRLLRLPSFGILWFFITLSVESSVVPIPDVIFEHRVYLPSVGAFITLAAAGGMAATRRFRRTARLPIILAASLIIALSGATYHRNRVWESDLGLWEDVVAKSPGKSRAHYNLGNILKRDGRIDEAIEHYLTAIHLKPFSAAYNNLGMAYQDKGMPDVAIEQYRQAIHLQQDNATAHNNLASAYWEMGRIDEAIEQFEIAVKIEPDYVNARYNLGMAYEGKGLMDKSIEQFETAMKLDPGDLSIAEALAKARERKRLGPAQQALPPDFRMKH
jgi:Tfp pilus assembly protein PilF